MKDLDISYKATIRSNYLHRLLSVDENNRKLFN